MCSQRLRKLLKSNRSVIVIKACNTKVSYTLVTRVLLCVVKLLILLRIITKLLLSASNRVVALAKKMAKPETKTVTRTVDVPKTKIVKQQTPQQQKIPKDTEPTDFTPIRPQSPLPNKRNQ